MKQRSVLLVFLVVITLLACQATALLIPEDGLVAYYSFDDGTAIDNSGNGHGGQIHGAVAISGVSGDALFFDGANDYINVSDSPSFNPSAFTIGAWAKFTGYGNDYQHIISKHVNYYGIREGYCLQYMKISKNLNFFTGTGGSSYNHINSGIIEPGDWHYIVGTFDGTEKRLYVDGSLIGTSSTNVVHSPNDLIIGCGGQFGSQSPQFSDFFLGSIDEVIVYDRTLTVNEIATIYDLYTNSPPVNQPPSVADDVYTTNQDTILSVPSLGVLSNDVDPEGDSLTASCISSPINGDLLLNADGSFTYTPLPGWYGNITFTYKANDGIADSNDAQVWITVNKAPIPSQYVINATVIGDGSMSPSGDVIVTSGENQTFNLLNNKKYQLSSITIDDITIDLKNLVVTFNNVFSDHTISAEFTSPSNKPPK